MKFDFWMPHELAESKLIDRITVSEMLLKSNEMESLRALKNGLNTRINNANDHDQRAMTLHKRLQSLD